MNLGVDFDDTITRDPSTFLDMFRMFRARGHKVYIVTWRFEDELGDMRARYGGSVDGIYATGRVAKERFMFKQGINIHVWVDDNPSAVIRSMEGFEANEELTGLVIPV